jgi:hypothetical protein
VTLLDEPKTQAFPPPAPEPSITGAPRKTRRTPTPAEAMPSKRPPRTGSGATKSADRITFHRFANFMLVAAVVAGGVGSIDGLLAAAEIAFAPAFHWVLPTALDVFLVGTAVATLALRERKAWVAVGFCILVSLALVGFSAIVNYTYWQSINEPGTLAYEVGPFIKGSMPVLLLVALEILAAINTTKRRSTPTSVTRLRVEVAKLKGEGRLRAKVAKLKAKRAARA